MVPWRALTSLPPSSPLQLNYDPLICLVGWKKCHFALNKNNSDRIQRASLCCIIDSITGPRNWTSAAHKQEVDPARRDARAIVLQPRWQHACCFSSARVPFHLGCAKSCFVLEWKVRVQFVHLRVWAANAAFAPCSRGCAHYSVTCRGRQ